MQDDGEESDEGPPGVGDGGEPRPELRGNPLAVSNPKDETFLQGDPSGRRLHFVDFDLV